MGLDLTLLPLNNKIRLEGFVLCHDRLSFDRNYYTFAQIADLNGKSQVSEDGIEAIVRTFPLPPSVKVSTYEDEGIRTGRTNPYGEEMVYALAGDLRKIRLPDNASEKNKAIMAYVGALEENTPIILEWQ